MYCTAEGSWSSPPPLCSKVYCPDLENVTNAKPMSSAHKYLDVAVYRCDPDYFLDSDRSIMEVNVTCQADGVWSENITGCWYRSAIRPTSGNGCRFVPNILSYKLLLTWYMVRPICGCMQG
ncbi:membrane cofactor protein-like [Lineus longissimus]|uniref:membrane cofactor protein-like n=1 Tax=Lineus longissimus TaxID=88925 RepID=UPI00315D0F8B